MKKTYIKPIVDTIVAQAQYSFLAGSNNGVGGTEQGGGAGGNEDHESSGSGSGSDGDFEGPLGAKGHNAWSSWDD